MPARITPPALSSEATLDVRTEYRTVFETHKKEERMCPANVTDTKSEKCTVIFKDVSEPITLAETSITYGAEPISYAQLLVLTNLDYDAKLARLPELRRRCERANVPRWIGATLFFGGLLTAAVSNGNAIVAYSGLGAATGGIGSFAIGYYNFGGRDCNRAHQLYDTVELSREHGMMKVVGEARAAEVKALADEFNRNLLRATPVEPREEPPPPAAAEEELPEPAGATAEPSAAP